MFTLGSVGDRCLVIEGTVRTSLVVEPPVLLTEHLGLQHGGEEFPVEQFVTEPTIEAFTEAVLPRSARLDVAGVYVEVLEVSLDRK